MPAKIKYMGEDLTTVEDGKKVALHVTEKEMEGELEITAEKTTPILQEKTVTPTSESQIVEFDEGNDGLSRVIVNAVQSTVLTVTPTTSEQVIEMSGNTFYSGVVVEAVPVWDGTVVIS